MLARNGVVQKNLANWVTVGCIVFVNEFEYLGDVFWCQLNFRFVEELQKLAECLPCDITDIDKSAFSQITIEHLSEHRTRKCHYELMCWNSLLSTIFLFHHKFDICKFPILEQRCKAGGIECISNTQYVLR